MDKSVVEEVVLEAISMANHSRTQDAQIPVEKTTALFGQQGHLDSMALVSLLIDIEDLLTDAEIHVSLSSESAMSMSSSPFRTIQSLIDFTHQVISDNR